MHKKPNAAWWAGETAIRVGDIPKHVPTQTTGKRISVATAYRWTTAGAGGVRIRRFKVGSSWCTTTEELLRWQQAVTELAGWMD